HVEVAHRREVDDRTARSRRPCREGGQLLIQRPRAQRRREHEHLQRGAWWLLSHGITDSICTSVVVISLCTGHAAIARYRLARCSSLIGSKNATPTEKR